MKKVLEWSKANWLPVVMGVVGIGAFGAGLYFSNEMSASQTDELQKAIKADESALNVQANRVTYRIDPVGANEVAIEHSHIPNSALTKWFKERRAEKAAAAKQVVDELLAHNIGPRTDNARRFLVQDLFPAPSERNRHLPRAMARAMATEAGARLMAIARAGTPPPATDVAMALRDRRTEQVMSRVPPGGNESMLGEDQRKQIATDLVNFRVRRYQQRAESIGVYGDPSVLRGAIVAPPPATGDPSPQQLWDWQSAYWAAEDVMRAIAKANEPMKDRGVPGAIVKRIEALSVGGMPGLTGLRESGPGGPLQGAQDPMNMAGAATPADPNNAPTNPAASVTGRQSGPGTGNGLYDLRTIDLTVIVAADQLPRLLDAIAQTNLMSVLKLDLEAVDPLVDLREGYYYGPQPVLRARLVIESLWLRGWTVESMPPDVKTALGVPPPPESTPPG